MTKQRRRAVVNPATVKSNLAELVAAKGKRDGEKITIAQLSRDTGIALNTIKRYLRGGEGVFDGEKIAALCRYLDCEIGDLLKIVDSGQPDVGESDSTDDQIPL